MYRCLSTLLMFGLFSSLSSCNSGHPWLKEVDYFSFNLIGSTVFTNPDELTTKELHFDTGRLLGKEVIIQGSVITWGEFGTHLVVKDEYGRLLVVTTSLKESKSFGSDIKPGRLKILGTVERGKKGLPFIFAKSIKSVEKASLGG